MSPEQKYEREIQEILAQLDDFPHKRRRIRFRRKVANIVDRVADAVGAATARLKVGQVMLVGIVMILAAYFFRSMNPELARYAIIIGVVLFFGAFVASLLPKGPPRRQEYRWRGRLIQIEHPTFTDRVRDFFSRLRRR